MKRASGIFLSGIIAFGIMVSGCHKDEPFNGTYKRVMIYYGCGYNDLSGNIYNNLKDELYLGELPEKNADRAVFVYFHGTKESRNYSIPNAPFLIRLYKDDGLTVSDTLKIYDKNTVSASSATLRSVLNEVAGKYKSESYGLVFSSHSTGWIPAGTPKSGKSAGIGVTAVGAQYSGSTSNKTEIDISDFALGIPYKLDYIVFDSCLMGGIEVAAELSGVCERILFSPAEILLRGFDYYHIVSRLVLGSDIDLAGVADDYYNIILAKSSLKYATATLVNCNMIADVKSAMASIISNHRKELEYLQAGSKDKVQPYYYGSSPTVKCFYDMRSIAENIGATSSELSNLDRALGSFIEHEVHTDYFFDLKLNDGGKSLVCGLSMYLPASNWPQMNSYYSSLAWNKSVKVIDK